MTMDVNGRPPVTSPSKPSPPSPSYDPLYSPSLPLPPRSSIKRTFDVAFLVAPDEKLARKHQQEKLRLVSPGTLLKRASPPPHSQLFMGRRPEPPGRSAFTKVSSGGKSSDSTLPLSLSPDQLAYQGSLSPVSNQNPYHMADRGLGNYPSEYLEASVKHIKTTISSPVSPAASFRHNIDSYLLKGSSPYGHVTDKELKGMRPGVLYPHADSVAYSTLASAYPFAAGPPPTATLLSPGVAAAVVSASLLPSTLAAFSLTAQNICAKCNISFRMTSDLVYHMRSHHKGDALNADPLRRRRDQEKLKCPVCSESFRERHHLTRHMTAHQDKDGDFEDSDDGGRRGRQGAGGGK